MKWYYLDQSNNVLGPLSEMALKDLLSAGVVTEHTQICSQTTREWTTFDIAFNRPLSSASDTSKNSNTPPPLKKLNKFRFSKIIAIILGILFLGLLFLGFALLFVNKKPADPLSSFEKELGFKLDRDMARLYDMSYTVGSEGVSGIGMPSKGSDFESALPSYLMANPNNSPEDKRLIQAGFGDARAGVPNRLKGIDINSIPEKKVVKILTLIDHIEAGDIDKVMELANSGNVNEKFGTDFPLNVACAYGNIQIAKHLLSLGAKLDVFDDSGRYPIHHAAASKNLELFTLLLEAGAKIDQKTNTPLERRDSQTSSLISSAGVDPNDGSQPIHIAASCHAYAICTYLLKNGVSPDVKDNNGKTPLQYASGEVWNASNANVIRLFDPEGNLEKRFRKVIGPSGQSIRTGGVYIRFVENTGRNAIDGEKKWVAHCFEAKDDFKVRLMLLNVDDQNHEDVIRVFRNTSKQDQVYSGVYSLTGDDLQKLKINLDGLLDTKMEILEGTAHGDKLSLKFMSMQEFLFPPNSEEENNDNPDFKFHAQ